MYAIRSYYVTRLARDRLTLGEERRRPRLLPTAAFHRHDHGLGRLRDARDGHVGVPDGLEPLAPEQLDDAVEGREDVVELRHQRARVA